MTRAQGATAFQGRAVWVLFNMQVWFHRDRLPAAHRINGDLLIVRTKQGENSLRSKIQNMLQLIVARNLKPRQKEYV